MAVPGDRSGGAALATVAAVSRRAGSMAIDLLLPPICLTCDAAVDRQGQLCGDCFRRTAFITAPCCATCGAPFAHGGEAAVGGSCVACVQDPPVFARARAAFRYDAQARSLIMPLKYGDRVDLARSLAPHMARAGASLLREAAVLVPVPLHRGRLFSRRYNQAALLARAIGRIAERPVLVDALRRVRRTAPLGTRDGQARAAVLEGAIAVRAGRERALSGHRILLIDDVMTSGATANTCARALLAAGASAVDILVAARVADPRLDGRLAA